jgi:hypothetical protein
MKKLLYVLLAMTMAFAMIGCPTDAEDDTTPPDTTPRVSTVTITGGPSAAIKGSPVSVPFTASVTGTNSPAQTVTWAISGAPASGTTINATTGILTVANDESLDSLSVTATSTVDTTKSSAAWSVTLYAAGTKLVESVTVTSNAASLDPGDTMTFTATVEGLGLDPADKGVTWSIDNLPVGHTTSTAIDPDSGELTVDADETLKSLVIKATAKTANPDTTYKSGTKTISVGAQGEFKITFQPWPGYSGEEIAFYLDDGQSFNGAYGITSLPAGPDMAGFEFSAWLEDATDTDSAINADTSFIASSTVYGYYRSRTLTVDGTAGDFIERVHLANGARAIYKFILPIGAKYSDYDQISVSFKVSEADLDHNLQNLRMYGLWVGNEDLGLETVSDADGNEWKVLNFNNYNTTTNPTGANFILDRQNSWGNAQFHANDADTWFTVTYNATGAGSNAGEGNVPAKLIDKESTFFYLGLGLAGNGKVYEPDVNYNKYKKDWGITQLIKNVTLVPKSGAPAAAVAVKAYGSGDDFAQFTSYIDQPSVSSGIYPSTRTVVFGTSPIVSTTCACVGCALNGFTLETATWDGTKTCTCDANNDGTKGDCPNNCDVCLRLPPANCLCPNGTTHLGPCDCGGLDCECVIAVCACDATHTGSTACPLNGKKFSEVTTEFCDCPDYCTTACLVCRAVGPAPAATDLVLLDSEGEYGTAIGTALEADIPRGNYQNMTDLNTAANALIPTNFDIRKYSMFSIKIELTLEGADVPIVYTDEITQVVFNMSIAGSKSYYSLGAEYTGSNTGNATVNRPIEENAVGALTFNFQSRGATQVAMADHIKVIAIVFHK